MKLLIAIIRDVDNDPVNQALISEDYRVTQVASTGGFLRKGSTTLMIGVADEKVERALQIIRENTTQPEESAHRRATIFVLNVAQFIQV